MSVEASGISGGRIAADSSRTPGAGQRAGVIEPGEPRHGRVHRQDSTGLTVQVVDDLPTLESLRPDYERLNHLTGNTLPFALHEWHTAWCKHFLTAHKHIHSRMMIHVLRDQSGCCMAIVPLMRTSRGVGPVRVTSVELLGADPAITEIRAPLIAPGYELRTARALHQSLRSRGPFHWVHWNCVGMEFGEALATAAGAPLQWQRPLLDYVLDLPPGWEELRSRLRRNIRESIRHCYNSLKREGLAFDLRIAHEPPQVAEALGRFFNLHTLRAARKDTVRHPDCFASPLVRGFLLDVCERLAQRGAVRVFELLINGEVVATRIGFVIGSSLYLYYSGYDPRWARYGVMTTTVVEAIKHAIASGLSSVNLSVGTDESKIRWAPRSVAFAQAVQISPSYFAQAAWETYRRARASPAAVPLFARFAQRVWAVDPERSGAAG
jgi:CelD/BcsL family acetyltransferase involved in cellulose biosynthesis